MPQVGLSILICEGWRCTGFSLVSCLAGSCGLILSFCKSSSCWKDFSCALGPQGDTDFTPVYKHLTPGPQKSCLVLSTKRYNASFSCHLLTSEVWQLANPCIREMHGHFYIVATQYLKHGFGLSFKPRSVGALALLTVVTQSRLATQYPVKLFSLETCSLSKKMSQLQKNVFLRNYKERIHFRFTNNIKKMCLVTWVDWHHVFNFSRIVFGGQNNCLCYC